MRGSPAPGRNVLRKLARSVDKQRAGETPSATDDIALEQRGKQLTRGPIISVMSPNAAAVAMVFG